MERATDGSGSGAVPWASMFDPSANMKALTAIQHEGFQAASALVERFVRIASAGATPTTPSAPVAPHAEDLRAALFGATDLEPIIRSWWSMVGQFAGAMTDGSPGGPTPSSGAATFDFTDVIADGLVRLAAAPSEKAVAEIWMVNRGRDDRGRIRLRCGTLLSDRGAVIESSAVSCSPASVRMHGRSSRGVDVTVDVGADVLPGVYRGTVVAEGFPEMWLPVEVAVRLGGVSPE